MRAFVAFVLRGRTYAITISSVCAALSLLLPPLSYISGGVIGLATLRHGATEGAFVVAGSVVLAGLFTALALGTPYSVLVFTLVTWIPVWLLAALLRMTASQGTALAAAGLLGAVALIGIRVVLPEPAEWWRQILQQVFDGAFARGSVALDGAARDKLAELADALAPYMSGLVVAGTVLGLILTLLLARWWHALAVNPGGFGEEFRTLRLDRRMGVLGAVTIVAAVLANQATSGLAGELLWVFAALYFFQGLAVVHSLVRDRNMSIGWLVGMYLVLSFFPPQMIVLLALLGLFDGFVDFRTRYGRAT